MHERFFVLSSVTFCHDLRHFLYVMFSYLDRTLVTLFIHFHLKDVLSQSGDNEKNDSEKVWFTRRPATKVTGAHQRSSIDRDERTGRIGRSYLATPSLARSPAYLSGCLDVWRSLSVSGGFYLCLQSLCFSLTGLPGCYSCVHCVIVLMFISVCSECMSFCLSLVLSAFASLVRDARTRVKGRRRSMRMKIWHV